MMRHCARFALFAAGLLLSSALFGQEKAQPEQYAATWAVVGGVGGGTTVPIDIRINRYNTDAEIKELAELLKEGGQGELRKKLEKEDLGQLSPTGRVGIPIAVARKLKSGNKTIIRVLTARDMSFMELRNSGRSVDYPFTLLEMDLDANGKGTGTAIGAAKIKFNKKKGIYEIESFQQGAAYNKLLNVYRAN